MEKFLSAETLILELLLIVTIVAIAVRQFKVPYTVALVLVGLALTLQQSITVDLTVRLQNIWDRGGNWLRCELRV